MRLTSQRAIEDAIKRMDVSLGEVRSRINRFAKTHPRFDELAPQIEQNLRDGDSLLMAYRRAVKASQMRA